tara:strand:- start:21 stop:350 length:330 start_codon:yes stop_codon:yes gene_type:complete
MIKLKDILKESSPGFENRQFGDPLPTVKDITKKYQEKNGIKEEKLNEIATGWKLYKVYDISDKLWKEMKYDLRDQFDELVKVGEDYGVFQNAQGTAKILKQIKRLMDKI